MTITTDMFFVCDVCIYSNGGAASSSGPKVYRTSSQFVDENGESDPEAEFLSTLTRREKKLLMQKLSVCVIMLTDTHVCMHVHVCIELLILVIVFIIMYVRIYICLVSIVCSSSTT